MEADKMLALARSQRLAHAIGVNGFFSALVREARHLPGAELVEWWSEARCSNWGKYLIRPDAYGAWAQDERAVEFLLEYDRHTEPLGRLAAKLEGYGLLAAAIGRHIPVLFCFAGGRREVGARRVLADPPVPVATAALGANQAPLEAVWLPIGSTGARWRLIDLADIPRPPVPECLRPDDTYPAWWYRQAAPPSAVRGSRHRAP